MRHRLTASRIALGRRCLWWARPDVEVPPSEVGRAAVVGTALHAAAEAETEALDDAVIGEAFGEALRGVDPDGLTEREREHVAELFEAWREWMARGLLTGVEPEVPVALSAGGVARRLERTTARDYSYVRDDELPGTADVVAVWAPNDGSRSTLFVGDYKTGRGAHRLRDHLDQLLHLGTAVARDEGHDSVRVAVLHVTTDGVFVDDLEVDAFEMEVHAEEMRQLLEQLAGEPAPSPGLHCEEMHCPARAVCPATRALLAAAQLELEPRRRLPVVGPIESDEQALAVLVGASLVEAWIAERTRAVRSYADARGGIQGPDGRVFKARAVQRETPRLDVAGAREVIEQWLGEDADKAIKTKLSTSFDAVRKVLQEQRKAGSKVPIKDTLEHVRAGLRQAGALKVSEFDLYDWGPAPTKGG